jgi:5-methyltetrahydropteroyltriglutamate--homocysteine methyltransferase
MKQSLERVLTTHTGSLFRPPDLLEMIGARFHGEKVDEEAFRNRLRSVVKEIVTEQAACGIDIVSDGEVSKPNFAEYVVDRFNGLGGHSEQPAFAGRRRDIPEYYADPAYFSDPTSQQMNGYTARRPLCDGPLSWKGSAAVDLDTDNLRSALLGLSVEDAFMPAPSPGILSMRIPNACYKSEEEYLFALADVLHEEYRAVVEAGFVLQIDAPDIPLAWDVQFGANELDGYRRKIALHIEALNHALSGIPEKSVRCHVCWGNYEGPHTLDIGLEQVVDLVLRINAQAYSIEAANPRHAHEWEIWRDTPLPEHKILIPGVIDSTTNFVEHPALVTDRILRYASVVGRERVIAGTDCGFGTFAGLTPRVHPLVVLEKLKALSTGAETASAALWP